MNEIQEMINNKFSENATDAYMEMFETINVTIHKANNQEEFYEDPIEGTEFFASPIVEKAYDPRVDWHPEYKAIFESVGESADMDDDEVEAWSYEINRPLMNSMPSSNVHLIKKNFRNFKSMIEAEDLEGNSNAFASVDFERQRKSSTRFEVKEPKRKDQELNKLFYRDNIDKYLVNAVKKAVLYKYWSNTMPYFSDSYSAKSKEILDRVNFYIRTNKDKAEVKRTIMLIKACLKDQI